MPINKSTASFLIKLIVVQFSFLLLTCEETIRITTVCDLTASIKFYNEGSDVLDITFADSTDWDPIKYDLDSMAFSHEDSTIHVLGNTEHYDTLNIYWTFEHHDIYEEGEACSAKVDLNIIVTVSQSDSVLTTLDLGLYCCQLSLDTSYTDTTENLHINKFSTDKTFFIP